MNDGKIIGIDYGTKQVGVAISDAQQTIAFPKKQVNTEQALEYITDLCASESVNSIVIGESTDFTGEDNPVMEDIREFKTELKEGLDLPVYFEPEFLTTKEASRNQSKRDDLDAAAAAIILRSFLNKQSTTDE